MLWLHVFVHWVDYMYNYYILKTFSRETPVIFGAMNFENEYQTKSHLWLMKLKIKWATKLRYHVFFATQRTGLHNQIVQDGISSLVNKFERWSVQMTIGKENLRVPFSSIDLSETQNAMSWVKTFQIAKV